jgi:hypothetical protein
MSTLSWAKDTAERVISTAVQSALAVVVASGAGWVDVDVWETAGVVAVASALSALKSALARQFGDPESASLVK